MMRWLTAVLVAMLTMPAAVVAAPPGHPVILVSIDGFRADYLRRGLTPNIAALARRGVRGHWTTPSFPSITFPNHWTLVTGKVPDENGFVGNTMYDPAIPGERFALSDRKALADPRWWQQATLIWVTAERAGIRTATMFWPGSEVAVDGVRPSDWRPFDGKVAPAARVDVLLGWLDCPQATRPGFVTLYFDGVDHAGHENGPDTSEVDAALADADRAVGRLVDGLPARHVDADVVIVSDYGMAAVGKGYEAGSRLPQLWTTKCGSSSLRCGRASR